MTAKQLSQYPVYEVLKQFRKWFKSKPENVKMSLETLAIKAGVPFVSNGETGVHKAHLNVVIKQKQLTWMHSDIIYKYLQKHFPDFAIVDGTLSIEQEREQRHKNRKRKSNQ